MNKTVLKLVAVVGLVSCSMMLFPAHEMRSPLGLLSRLNLLNGYQHYPFKSVDEDKLWSFDTWAGGYYRRADDGMRPKRGCDKGCCGGVSCSCSGDCDINECLSCCDASSCCVIDATNNTSPSCACDNYCSCAGKTIFDVCGAPVCTNQDWIKNRVPLAQLFFGKCEFRGEEAFFGGNLIGRPNAYPALSFAKLRPRFDYNERGVVLGMHGEKRFEDSKWRVGFNAALPIKSIEVEQKLACGTEKFEETMDDVVVLRQQGDTDPNGFSNIVFGYRLDFLSALLDPEGEPLVKYGDGDVETKIGGWEITDNVGPAPVHAQRRNDGHLSAEDFSPYNVDPDGNLDADGKNGINNDKLQFLAATNYKDALGVDRDAQGKLFIVPRTDNLGILEPYALVIQNLITTILELGSIDKNTATLFFSKQGICFCQGEKAVGLGDLDTSIYVGYDHSDKLFGELVLGLRFPTGSKNENPLRVLYVPTGNNGHFEARFGVGGGWRTEKCFALHFDASYSHVFEATERRAAAFKGATIKNVGPVIDTKVKWGYFLAHADATMFHPENQNLGFSCGYEFYFKRCDKVCFCPCCDFENPLKAEDFLGEKHELDPCLLQWNTKILTHKLRGQVFHRWNYCELFAGVSKIVGGRNGMREVEADIGFGINW